MRKTKLSGIGPVLIFTWLFAGSINSNGQTTTMPDVLLKNPIKEQINYIDEKTRIYENYRAIREDMFQKIKGNITDTISAANINIALLKNSTNILKLKIDSLNSKLAETASDLEAAIKTKNSIKLIGIEVNKNGYNTIMWTIAIALLALLALGFMIFKRNLYITQTTKKDLSDLKNEFEEYRKTTREAREKVSMAHFLEIKRLKGEK